MKKYILCALTFTLFSSFVAAEGEVLTGEKKVACEVLMCLMSSNGQPHECEDPLKEYFKIKAKKNGKKTDDRKNFLKKCPSGNSDAEVEQLVASTADTTYAEDATEDSTTNIELDLGNLCPNGCTQ
ncbi:MAG: TrbM/KikA/MpfK family conjugal transfer protein [Cellvibrionaceae bacterium]